MIFVLGILTLLALVGIGLLASTRAGSKGADNTRKTSTKTVSTDGVIRAIQEILRRDIWGDPPTGAFGQPFDYPLANDLAAVLNQPNPPPILAENNEPYDRPGDADPWLSPTYPRHIGHVYLLGGSLTQPIFENDILQYGNVSYIGTDINRPTIPAQGVYNPYVWADNTRTAVADVVRYGPGNLKDVPIIQQAPPNVPGGLVPGSTTTLTIAQSREFWNGQLALGQLPIGSLFPYFDTNADGIVDLYDADGDGAPDSPLSLRIPLDPTNPDDSKAVYAAVRIIDHSSMVNANVASSWIDRINSQRVFHESGADFTNAQRRGRRLTELLLEPVVHPRDLNLLVGDLNRASGLVDFRQGVVPQYSPLAYDIDIVRRDLIGGIGGDIGWRLYGSANEASLRHRGILPPYGLRVFDKALAGFATIDEALPWTMLWTSEYDPATGYLGDRTRWARLNSDFQSLAEYEGYDGPAHLGWRQSLLVEEHPLAIRRPMITTISHEVLTPPPGIELFFDALNNQQTDNAGIRTLASLYLLPFPNSALRFVTNSPSYQGPFSMTWPVLPFANYPSIPDHMRLQRVDLNMSTPTTDPSVIEGLKTDFIRHVAAAMYAALEYNVSTVSTGGVKRYQGLPVDGTGPGEGNRQRLSWQFALNMADFRDSDAQPTTIEFGVGSYLHGIEKQPFFTEAYARVDVRSEVPPNPEADDQWSDAVELYVPPGWIIDTGNLYLRTVVPGVPNLGFPQGVPLTDFQGSSGALTTLNGGQVGGIGNYYVLAASSTNLPLGTVANSVYESPAMTSFIPNSQRSSKIKYELVYYDSNIPETEHVLDVIAAANSGGALAALPGAGATESGVDHWMSPRSTANPTAPADNDIMQFSLIRSTTGWRFTTGWQLFSFDLQNNAQTNPAILVRVSLGRPNASGNTPHTDNTLDEHIPESVWASRFAPQMPDSEVPGGFASPLPFEAFDSVAEISRIFTIGPVDESSPTPGWQGQPQYAGAGSVTEHLALILQASSANSDLPDLPQDRVAAGRVDFTFDGDAEGLVAATGELWTWRLMEYFTTQGHLFDGVDNDGDGTIDEGDEGFNVLYRIAARINANTAPHTVLRSVPFMALMPTSIEFTAEALIDPTLTLGRPPLEVYQTFPDRFWDFAAAIVARRERRPVSVALLGPNGMQVALTAWVPNPNGRFAGGPFTSIGELSTLTNVKHRPQAGGPQTSSALRIDRFTAFRDQSIDDLAMKRHGIGLPVPADADRFSPDFRWQDALGPANQHTPYVDYAPIQSVNNHDSGGIRGRDIFLARLSNMLTTRSDVFTAYIALIDEDGNYVGRTQVTLDRSDCFREVRTTDPAVSANPVLPRILLRSDSSYADDTR